MRILIVNNYGRITGGADVHCLELAELLRERGHDVRLLATTSECNAERQGAFVPLTVSHSDRDALGLRDRARVLARSLWYRPAAAAADKLVREWRPDVAHCHKLYPQLSVAPVVRLAAAGIPVVQTVHDYEFVSASHSDATGGAIDHEETTAQYRALNTLLFQVRRRVHVPRVNTWVAVSRATAEHYARHGIHCEVLPNFVWGREGQVPDYDGRRGLLFFGRLTPEKGIRDVLELARSTELPLSIAGSGPLEGEVRAAADALDHVEYLGLVDRDEIRRRVRAARVVLMPSRWEEPGPLAALEAMEAGTPVVAYQAGGLGEYIADARAGAVVSPEPEALIAAAREFHDRRSGWQAASSAGREAVGCIHHPQSYVDRLTQIYHANRSA